MATSTDRPLEDYEIARPLADQFRVSFGLDAAPKTLAEWADVTARALRGGDFCGKFDEYCRGGSTPHGVSVGDRVARFRGLFDTLLVAVAYGGSERIAIRSRSPVSGRPIGGRIADGVVSFPGGAVVSFGVAGDVVAPEYFDVPPIVAYCRFNQYSFAFRTEPAYEAWAATTSDARTMSLSFPVALATAERLLAAYREGGGRAATG